MTLEEAQERIIELTEQNQTLSAQNETLSQNNETLTAECENLRTLNQKYFNKLIAQETPEDNNGDNEPDEVPTCEEFAKDLNI